MPNYDLSNPAIAIYGVTGYGNSDFTRINANGTEIVFVVNGTDATARVYDPNADLQWSVDGGAFVNQVPYGAGTGNFATVSLFSGLSAGDHLVVVKAVSQNVNYVATANFVQVSGGTGAIRAPGAGDGGGYGVCEHIADASFGASGSRGAWNNIAVGGHNSYLSQFPNATLRRKVKATGAGSVRAWVYQDGSKWAVYLNDVKQATVTTSALNQWGWVTMLAGADLSAEPEFRLALAHGVTAYAQINAGFIDALMTVGAGAALSASAVAARPILVGWGDSKTRGEQGTGNDASLDVLQLLCDRLGLEPFNFGIGGDTEGYAMQNRSGQLTGISPAPALVLDRFGHNDSSPTQPVSDMIAAVQGAYAGATKIIVCGADNSTAYDSTAQAAKSANRQAAVTTANDPNVTYVPMTNVISASPYGAGYDTADGIHENAQGYLKDYNHLLPFVAAALGITLASPPVITSAPTTNGTAGEDFTFQVTASNSPTSYNVTGTLPAGLTFNSSTGVIFGVPTAAGTYNVTVQATNAGGTGSHALGITIAAAPPTDAEPPSLIVAINAAGNQLSFEFSEPVTGMALTDFGLSGRTLSSLAGSGANYTASVSPVVHQDEEMLLTYVGSDIIDGVGNQLQEFEDDYVNNFSTVPYPPAITSDLARSGVSGANFSYTITASNAPTSFGATNLPTGLTRSGAVISGVLPVAGSYNIGLSATNAGGTGAEALVLTVSAAPTLHPPVISSSLVVALALNLGGSYRIVASNSPTAYSASGLPAGMSLLAGTPWIVGVPTVAGTYSVTITATNADGSDSKTLVLTVAAPSSGGIGGTVMLAGRPLSLVRGFDYYAADGRAIVIALPDAPDLTSAIPTLLLRTRSFITARIFTGQIITVDGVLYARFELSRAQTLVLDWTEGIFDSRYQVAVTLPNAHRVLEVEGQLVVRD